jgi:hypothetical protein
MKDKYRALRNEIEDNIRKLSLGRIGNNRGLPLGSELTHGYVCGINDDLTVDVQELDTEETEDWNYQPVGFHKAVKLNSSKDMQDGYVLIPQMYSEVTIRKDPDTMEEIVVSYTSIGEIRLRAVDKTVISVEEVKPFSESDNGLDKDYFELEKTGKKAGVIYTSKEGGKIEEFVDDGYVRTVDKSEDKIEFGDVTISKKSDGNISVTSGSATINIKSDGTMEFDGNSNWMVKYNELQQFLSKLLNLIGTGTAGGSPLTTAPQIMAMASEIPNFKSAKLKLGQ